MDRLPPSTIEVPIAEVVALEIIVVVGIFVNGKDDGKRREFGVCIVRGGGVNDSSGELTMSDAILDCKRCCGDLESGVSLSVCLTIGVNGN